MFLKPNYFSNSNSNSNFLNLLDLKTSRNNFKNYAVSKTFLTFCSSDKLSSVFSSASNFKNFSSTIFSHRRSDKFWKQNAISISFNFFRLIMKVSYKPLMTITIMKKIIQDIATEKVQYMIIMTTTWMTEFMIYAKTTPYSGMYLILRNNFFTYLISSYKTRGYYF